MHIRRNFSHALIAVSVLTVAACSGATNPSTATLVLQTDPDLSGNVIKVEYESGNGPGFGPYSQWDIWVLIPPASSANAGVVLPVAAPVFLRRNGGLATATASQIRVGDRLQVWRDPVHVSFGAVQGPPGVPTYEGTQIVIVR